MVVRRPGWLLCREVENHVCVCISYKNSAVPWLLYVQSCYLILVALPSLGGCWALLSEVPAAGHWGPSVCCGQRKPWQGAGLLQEVLLWEGLCGSEGLLFQAAPPTHSLCEGIKWNVDYCIIWDTAFISSSQKNFYGPQERWMFLSMFLRIGVWRNLWRAYRRGFRGNIRGEGLVLGGVFVIGPGDQVGSTLQNKTFLSTWTF